MAGSVWSMRILGLATRSWITSHSLDILKRLSHRSLTPWRSRWRLCHTLTVALLAGVWRRCSIWLLPACFTSLSTRGEAVSLAASASLMTDAIAVRRTLGASCSSSSARAMSPTIWMRMRLLSPGRFQVIFFRRGSPLFLSVVTIP